MHPNQLPADYTRCVNKDCYLKEQCKRWLTIALDPVDPQRLYSVALFRPIGTECDNMIKEKPCPNT